MGCGGCCGRCLSCISRIPYGSTVGIFIAIVGMLMFVSGFVLALKEINGIHQIKGMLDFGNTIAGVIFAIGIISGILVLLFSCCTTGDTRSNIFSGIKSKRCGKFLSVILIFIEYILYIGWALLSLAMVVPFLLQIILNAICQTTPKCIDLEKLGLTPVLGQLNITQTVICSKELINFCNHTKNAGKPLLVALIGPIIAALGTVHILMCLSANFAYVNSFQKVKNGKNRAEHVQME